jgi:hypothetical protein
MIFGGFFRTATATRCLATYHPERAFCAKDLKRSTSKTYARGYDFQVTGLRLTGRDCKMD